MKKKRLSHNYFISTFPISLLLLLCLYCVLACEFGAFRFGLFSVSMEQETVNKINNILKALSSSYIAGVIFFFLSDTIPYYRRKRIATKHVENSLHLMINAIDDFSYLVNGKIWGEGTDAKLIYEDITGGEYTDDLPPYKIPINLRTIFGRLFLSLNTNLNFIISQELYLNNEFISNMESIVSQDNYLRISQISNNQTQDNFVNVDILTSIFDYVKSIKVQTLKYI